MSDLMSFTSVFESVSVTSTTTGSGANVVYIVPANFDLELTYLTCTNGASTQNINVQVYHADTTSYSYILRSHSVAGNDSYNILTSNRIFLHAGDKVLAYKGGGTFDVILSGKQYYNPVRTI